MRELPFNHPAIVKQHNKHPTHDSFVIPITTIEWMEDGGLLTQAAPRRIEMSLSWENNGIVFFPSSCSCNDNNKQLVIIVINSSTHKRLS